MPLRIRHAKADRDLVQKQRPLGRLTAGPQIVAGAKYQLVVSAFQLGPRQKRCIRAPVGVGHNLFQLFVTVAAHPVQHDLQTRRRPPARRIKDMSA